MNKSLQKRADAIGFKPDVQSVTTTYCYKPQDEAGKAAIMEGSFPEEVDTFLFFVSNQPNVEYLNSQWFKDPSGPYIWFTLRENL